MADKVWSFDTTCWTLIPPQVAKDLRIFPIGLEGETLILLYDPSEFSWEKDEKLVDFERIVRNNLGDRPIRLVSYEETEYSFEELLDQFYRIDDMPQVISLPVTRSLGTVVLIDPNRKRAKRNRDDLEQEGYDVKYAGTLKNGLRIIKAHGGMVRTVFVASDELDYDEAEREINTLCETNKCQRIDPSMLVADSALLRVSV
jgi:hypothetical protein